MKKTSENSKQDIKMSHLDYLEQVEGSEALAFAHKNNKISDARLKTDKRYQKTYKDILKIVSAKDKLPSFYQMNGQIYSFWQDTKHIRGILRKTSVKSFNSGKPIWKTVLDIDKLAKTEKANWAYKDITCLEPSYDLCLIRLSDGGKDAAVLREFNLKTQKFVKDGFYIPESKSYVTWLDKDTLLVGDGTNPSTLTTSGYPSQIKLLKRGETLKSAKVILECAKNYVSASVSSSLVDGRRFTILLKSPSFFEFEFYLYNQTDHKIVSVPLPRHATIDSQFKDYIIFSVREHYKNFPAGSLLAFKLGDIEKTQPQITPIFIPTETSFYEFSSRSKNYLWVSILNDVKRQVLRFSLKDGSWSSEEVDLGGSVGNETLVSLDKDSSDVYMNYSDFLTPTSVYYVNEDLNKKAKMILKSPSRFKSKDFKIAQYKTKSKDGTLLPYFVVYPKKMKYNGQNPTLLYGYGGFEISMTANYLGSTGKVWLEKGGVYVLSNIRGGGEYGPKWHRSALRENRHKAYEDFYAIAEDLISRKITSPQHLGIRGGSNGGLLTSVAFTQRPELFNAVISEVPLANMLEYHQWLAGASWMEEYGNPEDTKMKKYLLSYSPLHNLKKDKKYPEVFYLTSTKDDRVHPGHARQMVARLQELGHPVLYNENTDGGHGRASNMKDLAEFLALEFTYLYQKLQ